MAAEARLAALGWDGKGLEGRTTEEIVGALAALGVEVTEEGFRELAIAKANVEAVALEWERGKDLPREWEDIPYFAARAMWPRWAPDLFAPEVFLHEHVPDLLLLTELPTTPENGQRHWRAAQATLGLLAPAEGPPRPDLLEQLEYPSGHELGLWMGELPFALAAPQVGMLDEAIELCRRMATVCRPEAYLGDLGVILVEAGRRDEAFEKVQENLARFPGDVWVRLKAGDVWMEAGDLAKAETLCREAYAMTDAAGQGHDRYGAVERLLDLYREAGRDEAFEALASAEKDLLDAWETAEDDEEGGEVHDAGLENEARDDSESEEEEEDVRALGTDPVPVPPTADFPSDTIQRSAPKVGRNDPCPCGSGKKHKRCCAA